MPVLPLGQKEEVWAEAEAGGEVGGRLNLLAGISCLSLCALHSFLLCIPLLSLQPASHSASHHYTGTHCYPHPQKEQAGGIAPLSGGEGGLEAL